MGYKNILLYAEGLAGWSKAGLPLVKDKDLPRPEIPLLAPSKVQEQLSDVYLVDYRPEGIYKQGHITGSHNIPSHQFSRRYQEIPMNKKIILIDVVGNALAEAAQRPSDSVEALRHRIVPYCCQFSPSISRKR